MNRYLGLSGALHLGLVAGLLYLGAKNDFSPHKLIESFTVQTGGETTAEVAQVGDTAQTTGSGSPQVIDDSFVDDALAEIAPKTVIQKQVATGHKNVQSGKEKISGKISQKNSLKNTAKNTDEKTQGNSHGKSEQKAESSASEQVGTEDVNSDQVSEKATSVSEEETSAETQGSPEPSEPEEKEFIAAAETEETSKSAEKTETQNQDAVTEQDEKQILAQKKALLEDLRRQNAEKEAQEAAALAAMAKNAISQSDSSKEAGSKDDGKAGIGAEGSGGPAAGETVHALADFKQTAGNPKPKYDREDRMKNRSGTVTFQAFVKKDGSLDEFQMIESSGHRSLDAKTLKALKQWKFAAGQQGWIEIPFRWDLKGGVQEMPSLRSSMKE